MTFRAFFGSKVLISHYVPLLSTSSTLSYNSFLASIGIITLVPSIWFDPDHYSTAPTTFTPEAIEAAYDGEFMPVTASGSTDNILWEIELDTVSQCETRASQLGRQLKDQILGTRVIIPMDARNELYDRVELVDKRGT